MVAHRPPPTWVSAELVRMIDYEAKQLERRLPAGYDRDDLASVGNEAVVECMARLDPETESERAWNTMRLTVRNRMKDFLRSLRVKGRACCRLPADADGNELPVADRRRNDPADLAAVSELLTPGRTCRVVFDGPAGKLLRDIADAIDHDGIIEGVRKLNTRARLGDAQALRAVVDLANAAAKGSSTFTVEVGDVG